MSEATPTLETLFARLLCDVMIPAEFSAAIRAQGYDVAEARTSPLEIQPAAGSTGRRVFAGGYGAAIAEVGKERRLESVQGFLTSESHPC